MWFQNGFKLCCKGFEIAVAYLLHNAADPWVVADELALADGYFAACFFEGHRSPVLCFGSKFLGFAVEICCFGFHVISNLAHQAVIHGPEILFHFFGNNNYTAFILNTGVRHGAGKCNGIGSGRNLCPDAFAQIAGTCHKASAPVGDGGRGPGLTKKSFVLEVAVELVHEFDFEVGEDIYDKAVLHIFGAKNELWKLLKLFIICYTSA